MSNKPDKSSFLRAESELILDLARQEKEKKIADLGSPIKLKGQALDMAVRGNSLWVAENTGSVLVIDLTTNETVSTYQCHQAPLTTFAFVDKVPGSGDGKIVITGSWDKTIKVLDTETNELLSTTQAHSDFVKALLVLQKCNLLVSASSDKVLRLWDLSNVMGTNPLVSVGSISAHTRPVEALGGETLSGDSAILYSADTMGVLKVWLLERDTTAQQADGLPPRWRTTLRADLIHHRTRINQLVLHNGYIWTASADETVKIHPCSSEGQGGEKKRPIKPIQHPTGVKALLPLYIPSLDETYLFTASGEIIRSWDTSDLDDKVEQRNEIDGHWHEVTLLKAWITSPDPYILSASLDGTIRRWKLKDLLASKPLGEKTSLEGNAHSVTRQRAPGGLTEEEERELDELLNDDD